MSYKAGQLSCQPSEPLSSLVNLFFQCPAQHTIGNAVKGGVPIERRGWGRRYYCVIGAEVRNSTMEKADLLKEEAS